MKYTFGVIATNHFGVSKKVEHQSCSHKRGKHAGQNTDRQSHSKSLHWAFPHIDKDNGGNQCSDVCVKNSPEGFIITGGNSAPDGFAYEKFFPNTLEDQYVGIHCHAYC